MGSFFIMKHYVKFNNAIPWNFVIFMTMIFYGLLISENSIAAEELYAVNASTASLKAKYTELNKQLLNNQFSRPIFLHSEESSHDLKGEIGRKGSFRLDF